MRDIPVELESSTRIKLQQANTIDCSFTLLIQPLLLFQLFNFFVCQRTLDISFNISSLILSFIDISLPNPKLGVYLLIYFRSYANHLVLVQTQSFIRIIQNNKKSSKWDLESTIIYAVIILSWISSLLLYIYHNSTALHFHFSSLLISSALWYQKQ